MRSIIVVALAGCGFHLQGAAPGGGGGGGSDGSIADGASDGSSDGHQSCTAHELPPSVNVDATQWSASFLTAPAWQCNAPGTTTISVHGNSVSMSSTNCSLGTTQFTNDVPQIGGGPNVLVVRLSGLALSNGHVLGVAGDRPIVLLVAGDVSVDSGAMIDASASGATPGPGGSMSGLCADQNSGLGQPGTSSGWGGGGGGFGTAGGQGCFDVTNGGLATGDTSPLRGGCSGGISPGNPSTSVGAGGGAIEISASGTIAIGATAAANVVASGGGAPATSPGGGNGGGSGGAILLVASSLPALGANGALRAHGGAGSQGCGSTCGTNAPGTDGHKTDNTQATDTSGIAGGGDNMDHGRQGGLASIVGGAPLAAQAGDMTTAQMGGRGGGGGGGGRITIATGTPTQACD